MRVWLGNMLTLYREKVCTVMYNSEMKLMFDLKIHLVPFNTINTNVIMFFMLKFYKSVLIH